MNKPGMKQMEVLIMGHSYLLACPEGGEATLLDAVEKVDSAMCRIRDAGKVKARDRIAVLASLNLAFELSQKESLALQAGTPTVVDTSSVGTLATEAADPVTLVRMNDLIRRLDQTLGSDGQLL